MRLAALLVAIAIVIGCQHDVETTFPPGLQPIGADPVAAPATTGGNTYPETLSVQQGTDSTSDYAFATGYVDADIGSVWAAFKIPNVVVDRHNITSFTTTENVEPGYDVSFLTAYTINSTLANVDFSITWREGVVAGSEDAPTQVSVVYEKTSGSSFVTLMEGSIQLTSVVPGVTELQFVQRMEATSTNSTNIASWTNEMFASVVAQVHGQPLP